MPVAEEKLRNGVAVITSAGAGIGASLARQAGELGMTVVVTDISLERAEQTAQEISEAGGKAEAVAIDVSKAVNLDQLAETVFKKHGSVRLLINNADIETLGFTWEIPLARWEASLNTNLHGVIHSVRAFLPRMLATGEECWVANLSSVGALGMMPTQAAYILTKHAIQSFSECLYLEMQLKGLPIHVSSVLPGMLKTRIFDEEGGKDEPESAARYRTVMRDMMENYGMDLEDGCRVIMQQVAEGKFWVKTQPSMTDDLVSQRVDFIQQRLAPELPQSARSLLGQKENNFAFLKLEACQASQWPIY